MTNVAAYPLTVMMLTYVFRDVEGAVTVSGSGGTGIPNQQALTLRCNYTVTPGDVVTGYIWRRGEGFSTVLIASGSVTAQTAIFSDSWQNKGVFVGDYTSTLDIQLPASHVTPSYAGTYRCEVTGVSGFGQVDVTASVLAVPSISGLPSTYTVMESSSLRIDCSTYTTPGNPPTTSYTWTYGGSTISTGAVLDRSRISRSQRGSYTCTASNTQGSDSASVNVDVQYTPSISGLPPVQTVTEFSNLRIDCSTYTTPGNPPTTGYTWTYGGSVSTGAVLDRSSISRNQGGSYTCTASNTLTPSGGSQQQGTATAQVNVDVQYGPGSSVTITPSGSLERVEGSGPFTATCTAVCNPRCTITWRKDNSDLTSGQISLSNVSRTDQGDYTCQAQNSIGGPQQKSITLVVYYLASPHLTFNKSEVMENATVTVNCDVDSNPTVQMTVRNVDNNTVLVQRNTNTLSHTIQRAQCLHNGSYICSADNRKTGTVHHTTMPLNVLCSPRHDFRKELNGVVAQHKNTTASLTADIIANPLPNFTWYRYDGGFVSPIRNTTGITVTSTALQSVLQIYITSDANYGGYAVSVQNSVGQDMMVFTLTSQTQPSAPTDLQVYTVVHTSISLQWISAFNGGSTQTFTVRYKSESQWTSWRNDTADPGKGKQVRVTVTDLKPGRVYMFQVFGVNTFGKGGMAMIQGTTLEANAGNIAAVGGGIGAALLVILIVFGVLVILHKRGVLKSKDENTQDIDLIEGRSKEEPEIQENDIYETSDNKAGGAEYAVVKKKATEIQENDIHETSDNKAGGAEYAVVKKKATVKFEDVYAKPEKKVKAKDSKEKDKKKKKPEKDMKKDRKPAKGRRNREDVYENTAPGQNSSFANAGFECVESDKKSEGLFGQDKDGLLYVHIDFGNQRPSQYVHRAEESTEYAAIAFGEVGPPAPLDEYEEQI